MDAAFPYELQLKSIFHLFLVSQNYFAESCDHLRPYHHILSLSLVCYRHCPLNIFLDSLLCP